VREEPFGKVFKSVARLCGLDPARMSTELAESLAGWIEQRVTQAWEAFPWPELCPVEERYYAPAHDSGHTYAVHEVVRVTADGVTSYYTLLNAGSQAIAPGTNEAVWQTAAPARFIDLDQAAAFGVKASRRWRSACVWRDDPRKVRGPREVAFTVSGEGVWLDPHAPASVFVQSASGRRNTRPCRGMPMRPMRPATWFTTIANAMSRDHCAGGLCHRDRHEQRFRLSFNGTYEQTELSQNGKPIYAKAEGNLCLFHDGTGWSAGVLGSGAGSPLSGMICMSRASRIPRPRTTRARRLRPTPATTPGERASSTAPSSLC